MSALCATVRDRLPEYLEDALSAEDRRAYREHLACCDACRDRAAEMEPSLLFARLAPEEVSSEDVARVLAGVRVGISIADAERRAGHARKRGRRRVAAMASAAALVAMTLVLPGSGRRPAAPVVLSSSAPAAGFAPAAQSAPSGTFPTDATIYDWNPGAASEEPRVVWIVDRSLDI